MRITLFIAGLLFFTLACSKEECSAKADDLDINLSDKVQSHLAIFKDKSKAIYLTANGDSVFFNVKYSDLYISYRKDVPCEIDPSFLQEQTGQIQRIEIELKNPILEMPVFLFVSAPFNVGNVERIVISSGNYRIDSDKGATLLWSFGPCLSNEDNGMKDSVVVKGKTYYNVVEGVNGLSNVEVKFNKKFGVFYIREKVSNIELVLDRYE